MDHVWEFHIRFRFDKSKSDFTTQKFQRQPTSPIDPVLASVNLIRQAHLTYLIDGHLCSHQNLSPITPQPLFGSQLLLFAAPSPHSSKACQLNVS
jgi:hypothetical protein